MGGLGYIMYVASVGCVYFNAVALSIRRVDW